jgi:hypothetical protein
MLVTLSLFFFPRPVLFSSLVEARIVLSARPRRNRSRGCGFEAADSRCPGGFLSYLLLSQDGRRTDVQDVTGWYRYSLIRLLLHIMVESRICPPY